MMSRSTVLCFSSVQKMVKLNPNFSRPLGGVNKNGNHIRVRPLVSPRTTTLCSTDPDSGRSGNNNKISRQINHQNVSSDEKTLDGSDDDENHSGSHDVYTITLSIPTTQVMEEVGALIAVLSRPTDSIFLDGDLGSGKTTFSRGFIGCKLGIPDDDEINDDSNGDHDGSKGTSNSGTIRITSPTYLLSNMYAYYDDEQQLQQ